MIALVTGASQGIGRAITLMLAGRGFNVYALARDKRKLQAMAAEFHGNITPCVVDCAIPQQLNAFINAHAAVLAKVGVLVNNAGAFIPAAFIDETVENLDTMYNLNVRAVHILSRHISKNMAQAGGGHIFNICSVASKYPQKNFSGYAVTKAAMLSLNNVMRQQLAEKAIKVTAILPAQTLTASWEGTPHKAEKFVQPEDIALLIDTALNLSAGANIDEITISPLNF